MLSLDYSDRTRPTVQKPSQDIASFTIGGVIIRVHADVPIADGTFAAKLQPFRVENAGTDTLDLQHHFTLPVLEAIDPTACVYREPPWAIYRRDGGWLYLGVLPETHEQALFCVARFNEAHTDADIYHPDDRSFREGGIESLSLFPTDQIWLARVLADRQACLLHAAGMDLGGRGFLFLGHSSAGKSTMVTLLRGEGTILCDDRMIVRRWPDGWRIHGTWSHGDVPDVSPGPAPLRALLFLEQADENRLIPMARAEVARRLPFLVIKPLVTADWWEKTFDTFEHLVAEVPAYRLRFDLTGRVREVLAGL